MANANFDLEVASETAINLRKSTRIPKIRNNMNDFVTKFNKKKSKKLSIPIIKDQYSNITTITSQSILINDKIDVALAHNAVDNAVIPEILNYNHNIIELKSSSPSLLSPSSSSSSKFIKKKASEHGQIMKAETRKSTKMYNKIYYQSAEMEKELIDMSTSCSIPIEILWTKVNKILSLFRKFYSESIEPGMIVITPTVEYTEAVAVIDGDCLLDNNVNTDDKKLVDLDDLKLQVLLTLPSWTFHVEENHLTDTRPFAIRVVF